MSLIKLGLLGFDSMTHALVKSTIKIGKDPACSIAGFHVLFIIDSNVVQLTNATAWSREIAHIGFEPMTSLTSTIQIGKDPVEGYCRYSCLVYH